MPRALEPGKRRCVVLPFDQDKPKELQPRFYYASQSLARGSRIGELMDRTRDAEGSVEVHERVIATLKEVITDWENLIDPETGKEIPFSVDRIPDVLTMADANELLTEVFKGSVIDSEDQKKLESQP